jgi:hypothetical protein
MFDFRKRTHGSFASPRSDVPWPRGSRTLHRAGGAVVMGPCDQGGSGRHLSDARGSKRAVAGERRRTYAPQRLLLGVARYQALTRT